MSKIGQELAYLMESIKPALLLDHDAELDAKDLEKPGVVSSIWPYARHVLHTCEAGERFKSDCWQNTPGWAVNVPEIIQHQGVTYLLCRWWNWIGGFTSRINYSSGVTLVDGKELEGWIVYKQGQGYQSNSRYFVGRDGSLFEYKKDVISHEPVRYLPTGGYNVGYTETIIYDELQPADEESRSLLELVDLFQESKKKHETTKLRPIMEGYFS